MQISQEFSKTNEYEISPIVNDYRDFSVAKNGNISIEMDNYTQMFDDKYGFISNLSILDLLFMEGPNSISYLESVKLL